MNCKSCRKTMGFVYEVVERETAFVLWECACGNKLLERKPADEASQRRPAETIAASSTGTGASS
jgi:hypothetical protein